MEGVETKSFSLVEGSQIGSKFSTCLAENVEGFQQCVKEILKLIEQDGNLSETTSEFCDGKKSKLTTHVAELSRMHAVLVDQHAHLIGEFSKDCESKIEKQYLDSYDSSSPQVTQMFTPDKTSNTRKCRTPIGLDALLSSGGGGSYASRREGSESSFSLSSDSDSESFMSINKLRISPVNDDALKVKETKAPEVQTLVDENTNLKECNRRLQEEVSIYVADISVRNDQITELSRNLDQSMSDIGRLKMEVSEKCRSVNDLNKHLDSLKLKKDEVTAKVDTLRAEKRSQDNLVRELETCLNSIQVEHVGVLSSFDNAQEVIDELKLKVMELEREVVRQREVIFDTAEEKREVIRQLSFSLEHYMSGYKQLRQAFIGNKKHVVLTF
ncbi:protein NETWORKED 4B [Helianthus annuus]|uniref:protein NETWORKED 4B n=1 Tax=Helianthus annuus TaxID=4232 RepID=UPI001652DD44|nr:protein NETWORKED 4B [Helianthus annuus]